MGKIEKRGTIVFDEENCITKMIDYLLILKGKTKKIGNKIVEYCLQRHAHIASEYDTWNFLNNLICERKIFKSGKGNILLKVFIGYAINDKKKSVIQ